MNPKPLNGRNRLNKIVYQVFDADRDKAYRDRVWKGIAAEMDRQKARSAGEDAMPFLATLVISLLIAAAGVWVYIYRLHHPVMIVGIGLYMFLAGCSALYIHHVYKTKL